MEACEREGTTASEAVRTFIDVYLKRSRRVKLKQIAEDLASKLLKHPLKTSGGVAGLTFAAIALSATPSAAQLDSDIQPIEVPTWIVYPAEMVAAGISAECEAFFDISKKGKPKNVTARCTHPGFETEVIRTTKKLRFEPKLVDGKRVKRKNAVYPYSFRLEE